MPRAKLALTLPLLLLAACSGADFDTPTGALNAFLDRSIDGDHSGARECLVANERDAEHLTFQIDDSAIGYRHVGIQMEGEQAVLAVRFPGESEDMKFVLVQDGGWYVSLGYTIARGMTENVGREVDALGPNATPEQMIEAMRRGMQNQPAARYLLAAK